MSILEEFYNGNIRPSEKHIKSNSEYAQISKTLVANIDKFIGMLNAEEKKIYEMIEEDLYKLNYLSEKECFLEGFRVGTQMTYEILHYESENYI